MLGKSIHKPEDHHHWEFPFFLPTSYQIAIWYLSAICINTNNPQINVNAYEVIQWVLLLLVYLGCRDMRSLTNKKNVNVTLL